MISGKTNSYVAIFRELLTNMYEVTEYNPLVSAGRYARLEGQSPVRLPRRGKERLLLPTPLG